MIKRCLPLCKLMKPSFCMLVLICMLLGGYNVNGQSSGWEVVGSANINASADYYNFSMVTNSSGIPYLAYTTYFDGDIIKKFNGTSWVQVGSAIGADGMSITSDMAVGADDTLYFACSNTGAGSYGGASVRKYNGTDWVVVGDSNFSTGSIGSIAITIDNAGVPYVLYTDYDLGWKTVVKKFNGSSWVTVGTEGFSAGSAETGWGIPCIKISPSGVPYVLYNDDVEGSIVKKINGTAWETVGSLSFGDLWLETYTKKALAFNSAGEPYVLMSDLNGYPTIVKYNGSAWEVTGIPYDLYGAGFFAFGIDDNDNKHVAFVDVTGDSQKISVKADIGGEWAYEGGKKFTNGSGPGYIWSSSLAFGADNAPYLAFTDPGSGGITVMKLNSCVSAIYGTKTVCTGATTTLADVRPGGTWISSNTSIATVGSSTGVVTGVASGTTTISYSYGSGCVVTAIVTVNPYAGILTGAATVPTGSYITLYSENTGGTWASSNTAIATVNESGIVTGVAAGTVNITYSKTFSCGTATTTKTLTVTVGAAPSICQQWVPVGGYDATPGVYMGQSALDFDRNGTPYMAYFNWDSKATVKKYNGSSWELIGTDGFSNTANSYAPLSIAIGTDGVPWVVYTEEAHPRRLIVRKFDGSAWQTVGPEPSIAKESLVPTIAFDGTGVPYVAYYSEAYGATGIKVKKYNGVNWVSVGGTAIPGATLWGIKLAIDKLGTPYVAFSNSSASEISVKKFDGSNWVSVGSGLPFPFDAASTFALGPDGTPYVAYADAGYDGKMTVQKFNGTTWGPVGGIGFSVGRIWDARIVIDGNGTPYVSFNDEGATYAFKVMKYDGSSWGAVGSTPVAYGGEGFCLGIDNAGNPYAYTSLGASLKKLSNLSVQPIFGYEDVGCAGFSMAVYDSTLGGIWSSSDTTIASIVEAWPVLDPYFGWVEAATGHVTGVSAGTATISYSLNGCTAATKVVTIYPAVSAGTLSGSPTVCTGGVTTISSTVPGGEWYSTNVAAATVDASTGVVTGVAPGTANISYSITSVCTAYAGIQVTVSASGSAGTITGTATVCPSATTTLSNATTGGTWSSGNPSVATIGSADGVVSGIASGTAIITYSISAGCGAAITTKVVTVSSTPSAGTITGTASLCASATTTLSNAVTGGVWTSGNTSVATINSSTGVVAGVTSGNATITYTVTTGCGSNTATKVVTVNSTPSAGTITGTLSVCASSTATLDNATSGGAWSSSNTSVATVGSSSGIVSGVAAGNATITYTVTSGCGTVSSTATVTVNAAPSSIGSITGTLAFCAGATSTLGNSATGGTWVSSNTSIATIGSSNGVASGVAAGNATITYTLTNECGSATATAIVTVNGTPSVGAITGTLSVCAGATTSLNNATGGGAWSSSNTAKGTVSGVGVVSGISAGTTTISYTVNNSCGGNSATAVVTVNPAPNAGSITGSSSVSTGSAITLSNAASGGAWSSSNGNATVNSSGVVTGVTVGTATISYTVTNGCGTATAIKVITINSSLSGITGTMSICVGGTSTLSIAEPGGTWGSSNHLFATVGSATGVVTGITPGTVTISYTLDGGTVTAVVTINGNPAISSGALSACPGSTITLSGAPSGGIWSSGTPGVATVSGGIVSGASSGTSVISYTNASGCADTRVVTINASPASISGTPILCVGTTVTFTNSTGGGTWSGTSTSVINGPGCCGVVTGMSAGTANITYNATGGCKSVLTITVNGIPANITGIQKACPGTSTTLACATGGGTWSSASTGIAIIGSSTGIVTGITAGTTVISYSLGTGCAKTAVVTINATPSTSVAGSTTICIGLNTTLTNATTGGTWASSNTSVATVFSTGVVNGISAGTANITYTVGSGCYTTTQVTVNAKPTINGATTVCPGNTITLTSPTAGGTWSNNNAAATIGSSTGILTGVTAGGSTVITYSLNASCYQVRSEAVSTLPLAIGGYAIACEGTTTTLTHSNAGTWSSGDASIASVGTPTVGVVTGVNAGTTLITFTLNSTGCTTTKTVTINTVPPAITGTGLVCVGLQTTLANAQAGGSWSSSNTYYANVGSATGIVTAGTVAGTATISYSYGANCRTTAVVSVRAVPAVILGPSSVCIGSTVTYSNSTGNGTWSSSNTSAATVVTGASSYYGAVTGVGGGVTTLTYTTAPSCTRTQTVTVAACRGVNTTGVGNTENNVAISLFPNPTTGVFTVSAHAQGVLTVYTLEGKEVSKHEVNKGETQISLPNELARGIYMCRFNGEDGSAVMVRLVVE